MLSIPDYIESDDPNEIFTVYSDECPLSAVRIEKDKFSDIGHRAYLGAVMGLGLTRENGGSVLCGNRKRRKERVKGKRKIYSVAGLCDLDRRKNIG